MPQSWDVSNRYNCIVNLQFPFISCLMKLKFKGMNTPSGSVKVHWNALCRLKMGPRPIPKRHHWLVLAAAARCGHPLTKRTLRIQSNLQFSQLLRFRELVTLTLAIGQNITITMHGSRNCPCHVSIAGVTEPLHHRSNYAIAIAKAKAKWVLFLPNSMWHSH